MKIGMEEVTAALEAFRTPRGRPDGVFTVREAAQAANIGERTAYYLLREMRDAGRLETVRFQFCALGGRRSTSVGYRIKKP